MAWVVRITCLKVSWNLWKRRKPFWIKILRRLHNRKTKIGQASISIVHRKLIGSRQLHQYNYSNPQLASIRVYHKYHHYDTTMIQFYFSHYTIYLAIYYWNITKRNQNCTKRYAKLRHPLITITFIQFIFISILTIHSISVNSPSGISNS